MFVNMGGKNTAYKTREGGLRGKEGSSSVPDYKTRVGGLKPLDSCKFVLNTLSSLSNTYVGKYLLTYVVVSKPITCIPVWYQNLLLTYVVSKNKYTHNNSTF
jgi:hypothetical protein